MIKLKSMPQNKQRSESLLFDYETTYRTSYRGGAIPEIVRTEYKEKPKKATIPPATVKDTQTLTPWKTTIPFYLLHKPKEIIRTNPYELGKNRDKLPELTDIDREKVQKSRPRLVMTPAVSMDDIEDGRAREILCRDMYTSDMMKALREAVTPCESIRAPFADHPAPANPILLPKLQPPRVPPEWRMESVSWDGRQLRGFCDPTRDFWLKQEIPKCKACTESATVAAHRKMLSQTRH